jgi:predicted nucleic acid-binding protein
VIVKALNYPIPSVLNVLNDEERDAIALALELGADVVLVDDLQAPNKALRMGLRIAGTLGVLSVAAELGKIDFDIAVKQLLALGFRASARSIELARPKRLEVLTADCGIQQHRLTTILDDDLSGLWDAMHR